jgi:hypothetical protein
MTLLHVCMDLEWTCMFYVLCLNCDGHVLCKNCDVPVCSLYVLCSMYVLCSKYVIRF